MAIFWIELLLNNASFWFVWIKVCILYIYVYVMCKVRIGTIHGLSCANLGSSLCVTIFGNFRLSQPLTGGDNLNSSIINTYPVVQPGWRILGEYTKHKLITNPWIPQMPNPWIAPQQVCKVWIKANPLERTRKKEWRHIHWKSCVQWYSTYSVHLSLEWLQVKMTSFPLPGSFLAPCFRPFVERKFLVQHGMPYNGPSFKSAYTWTHLIMRGQVLRQFIVWLCNAQIQGLCKTISGLSRSIHTLRITHTYICMYVCIYISIR